MSQTASEKDSLVVLYVFSGIHLGAELELGEGTFLIGSDDSCDIILHGSSMASRHAALTVKKEQSGMPEVLLRPLDGTIRFEEENSDKDAEKKEEFAPSAGSVWYAGLTCLVWNRLGVVQVAPNPSLGKKPEENLPAEPEEKDVAKTLATDAKNVATVPAKTEQTTLPDQQHNALEMPLAKKQRHPVRFFLPLLLIVALGLLSMTLAPEEPNSASYSEILQKKLTDAGYAQLSVSSFAQGVKVSGTVSDETALTQVRNLARELHCPVYLELSVSDDVAKAVTTAFQSRGFYPQVALEKNSGDAEKLLVAVYVQNGMIEEKVFIALHHDIPRLPSVQRKVVHQEELASHLEQSLREAGLDFVSLSYLPGMVELSGSFDVDSIRRARQLLKKTGNDLGVPIHSAFKVVDSPRAVAENDPDSSRDFSAENHKNKTAHKNSSQKKKADEGSLASLPGGLRVTGVTMSPLRFAVTSDGQRLFEGATLEGGYVVEKISTTTITLRIGNRVVKHQLRGSSS